MGANRSSKEAWFSKLNELLDEYESIFVVNIDNVTSQQMHQIRQALRGEATVLMGKNTMVRRALRRQLEQVETPSDFVERGLAFTRALIARGNFAQGRPVDKAWIDSLYEDD